MNPVALKGFQSGGDAREWVPSDQILTEVVKEVQ